MTSPACVQPKVSVHILTAGIETLVFHHTSHETQVRLDAVVWDGRIIPAIPGIWSDSFFDSRPDLKIGTATPNECGSEKGPTIVSQLDLLQK